jgi:hypothetical protein
LRLVADLADGLWAGKSGDIADYLHPALGHHGIPSARQNRGSGRSRDSLPRIAHLCNGAIASSALAGAAAGGSARGGCLLVSAGLDGRDLRASVAAQQGELGGCGVCGVRRLLGGGSAGAGGSEGLGECVCFLAGFGLRGGGDGGGLPYERVLGRGRVGVAMAARPSALSTGQ